MRKTKWSRMMKLMNGLLLAACLFTGSILTSQTIEAGQTSARAGSKIIYVNDNSGETGLAMYVPKGMTVSNKSSADKAIFTDTSLKPYTATWEVTVFRNEPANGNLENFLFRSMDDYFSFYKSEREVDDNKIQEMFREDVRKLNVNGTTVSWENIFWDYWVDEFYAVFALPTGSAVCFHARYDSTTKSEIFAVSSDEVIPKLLNEVVDCCLCGMSDVGINRITVPQKPTIKKPTAAKNKITVKWAHFKHTSKKAKKIWNPIKKVQIQCATDKAFKNIIKTTAVGKNKKKATIKGLKKKTTYYVRVRYSDGKGYSKWSSFKKIKTKK